MKNNHRQPQNRSVPKLDRELREAIRSQQVVEFDRGDGSIKGVVLFVDPYFIKIQEVLNSAKTDGEVWLNKSSLLSIEILQEVVE